MARSSRRCWPTPAAASSSWSPTAPRRPCASCDSAPACRIRRCRPPALWPWRTRTHRPRAGARPPPRERHGPTTHQLPEPCRRARRRHPPGMTALARRPPQRCPGRPRPLPGGRSRRKTPKRAGQPPAPAWLPPNPASCSAAPSSFCRPPRPGDTPALVQPTGDELTLLQPGGPAPDGVVLDQLTRSPDGALMLRGRARPRHAVRVYANGREIGTVPVADGGWTLTVPGALADEIRLFRMDEISTDGHGPEPRRGALRAL